MFSRLIPLALLVCSPALLLAEEAVEAVTTTPAIPDGAPWWVQALWPILFATVIPFLVGYLRKKKQSAVAEAEKIQLDANKSLMEQKNVLIDKRVIPFLWATAEHIAERDLPKILADGIDGDGKFDWKGHAKNIGIELKDLAIDKFKQEGIDIVQVLGEKYLGTLIDRAISKAIPWLPQAARPTVENLADGKGAVLAGLIIDKGLAIANKRWLNGKLDLKEE